MSPTFAFLIGLLTGLRSLTPAAAIARAAYLGWLHLPRPLAWMGTLTAVVIFSALALFELINDKRPTTPARTASPGLVARVVLGAFGGTCVAPALGVGVGVGLALGIVGALAGSNRSSGGGSEVAGAFGVEGRIGDLASMQAVT